MRAVLVPVLFVAAYGLVAFTGATGAIVVALILVCATSRHES